MNNKLSGVDPWDPRHNETYEISRYEIDHFTMGLITSIDHLLGQPPWNVAPHNRQFFLEALGKQLESIGASLGRLKT